jgi:hypothetical protein
MTTAERHLRQLRRAAEQVHGRLLMARRRADNSLDRENLTAAIDTLHYALEATGPSKICRAKL